MSSFIFKSPSYPPPSYPPPPPPPLFPLPELIPVGGINLLTSPSGVLPSGLLPLLNFRGDQQPKPLVM